MSDADPEAVADELDSDVILVADPEDYNQSRRMQAIHRSRRDVREAHRDLPAYAPTTEHYEARQRLARAVAHYGRELQPLMESAGWDRDLPDEFGFPTVSAFIRTDGTPPDGTDFSHKGAVPPRISMEVFGHLNRFARSAGLGVDLDDGTDEWEV